MELNCCFFSGYAVSGVKMQNLANGTFVGEFSIGINDPVYVKADGSKSKEHCNFVKVAMFGRLALALSKLIEKGTPIICQCRLRQNVWEQNGTKHYEVSFIADMVKVLPKHHKENEISSEFKTVPQTECPVPTVKPTNNEQQEELSSIW